MIEAQHGGCYWCRVPVSLDTVTGKARGVVDSDGTPTSIRSVVCRKCAAMIRAAKARDTMATPEVLSYLRSRPHAKLIVETLRRG